MNDDFNLYEYMDEYDEYYYLEDEDDDFEWTFVEDDDYFNNLGNTENWVD